MSIIIRKGEDGVFHKVTEEQLLDEQKTIEMILLNTIKSLIKTCEYLAEQQCMPDDFWEKSVNDAKLLVKAFEELNDQAN